MDLKQCVRASGPAVGMIAVQLIATGLQLLSRIILNNGTFIFALMAYRHVVAAVAVAPFAFLMERDMRNRLNWLSLFWLFINALVGITAAMGLFYYGLGDTTATYATNFLNLIPIATFIFSTIARYAPLGTLATAATFILILWTIAIRGPTYSSMFNPLSLIFVAISESLFFGEAIAVGSLMGMFVIILGLYAFLWGKRNESPSLHPLNANGRGTSTVPESTKLQLAAAKITPTVSLNTTVEEV
ncbi:hypothetical protein HHK36_029292 [Tetracentron sinense]|uniref:WAT1-related protein n=1 Tax=Tetracentron sinense TaxID=13715 RepID=A0A835D4B0_TETSI|nr:hypothetical protein HHK36_029292 [Tetracentron sinense]